MKDRIKKIFIIRDGDKINKKKLVCLCLLLMIFLGVGVSFGRYAYKEIRDFYLSTKKFYFNSDKLASDKAVYKIENWSGVGSYSITINVNSYENNNLYSEEDIYYDISYSCSDTVTCSIENNKTDGVISADSNNDYFTIVMTVPTGNIFKTGDSVTINVSASSTSPYKKSLSAEFTFVVGQYGLSYEIEDSVGSPYLDIRITNTLDYYVVREAFDNYSVDTQIDIDTYLSLSDENKAKCASSIITLTFDPDVILLDMTSDAYLNNVGIETVKINNYNYVKSISFKIDALASQMVKFYKADTTKNYTFPIENGISVIDVRYS